MNGRQNDIAGAPGGGVRKGPRVENLAVAYQEILTVVTRLRAQRQVVMDASAFRGSMKAALAAAEGDAVRKGYTPEDARLSTFAVVSFLDESVENSHNPNFADWPRNPMQQELFGGSTSGEVFFQCIDRLLALKDSPPDAAVLEVFALCLLLGYRGRQSRSGEESVRAILARIMEKVQRIRGPRLLAYDWASPQDAVLLPPRDPWVRALVLGTLGAFFLAVLFFVGFKFALLSGASELHSIVPLAPH